MYLIVNAFCYTIGEAPISTPPRTTRSSTSKTENETKPSEPDIEDNDTPATMHSDSEPSNNKGESSAPEPMPTTPRKSMRARKQTAKAMEYGAKLKGATNDNEKIEAQKPEENNETDSDAKQEDRKPDKSDRGKGVGSTDEIDEGHDANNFRTFSKMTKATSPRTRGQAKLATKDSVEQEKTEIEEDVRVEVIARIPERKVDEVVDETMNEDEEEMETQDTEEVEEDAEGDNGGEREEEIGQVIQIEPRKEEVSPGPAEEAEPEVRYLFLSIESY